MFLRAIFVCLTVSAAAAKYLCCLPTQFELQEGTNQVLKDAAGKVTTVICKSSVDYKDRDMSSSDCELYLPSQSQIRLIQDIKNKRVYTVDLKRKTCSNTTLVQVPSRCIPDGEKVTDFYFGQPSQQFDVSSYAVKYNGVTVYMGIAPMSKIEPSSNVPECSLVSATVVEQANISLMSSGYFNYTAGISDPSVFDIPPYCSAETSDLKYHPHQHVRVTTFI